MGTVDVYATVVYDPEKDEALVTTVVDWLDISESLYYTSESYFNFDADPGSLTLDTDEITFSRPEKYVKDPSSEGVNPDAKDVTVTFNANGGIGSDKTVTCAYGSAVTLPANSYTRAGFSFLGWSTDRMAVVPTYSDAQTVQNLTTSGNVTLYAIWLKTAANVEFEGRSLRLVEGDAHNETIATGMTPTLLMEEGYNQVKITVVFDAKRVPLIAFNNATLKINAQGKTLQKSSWDLGGDFGLDWTSDITREYTIAVSDLNSDGSFSLIWSNDDDGTLSTGEAWCLGTTNITVVAIK